MTTQKKQSSYWVSQMVICGVASVLFLVLGIFSPFFDKQEPGRGVIYILISLMFSAAFIWLVVTYRRMSVTQRAIFAWAITQQHSTNTGSDDLQLAIAGQAAAGTLPFAELQMLQALDPMNPYPAAWPSEPTISRDFGVQ
jgi:hypothetical protein